MALKTKEIVINSGRDKGKKFLITEMPVAKIDRWANRALLALIGAGADIPSATGGILEMAKMSFSALGKANTEEVIELMDELLECVQIVPEGGYPRPIDLDLGDVCDFVNLMRFRKEAFQLHIDFLLPAASQTSELVREAQE